jgi:phage recombination protein Bet
MTTQNLPPAVDEAGSDLAIRPSQTVFTPTQVAALRQIGVEDATDADLHVFFHHCRRTGLDPFARQIYLIGRETDVKVRVQLDNGNTRVETQRVMKYTIQTGIDGYRLIGKRAASRGGVLVANDEPQWCGKDGVWRDFWSKSDGNPVAAKYTIRVDGAPHTAVCMFDEYAQYSGKGELTSMWKKMPANQLAKCAEAQAWRKAFPADFSGIEPEGAGHAVIEPDGAPVRVPSQRRGVDGLRQALGAEIPAPERSARDVFPSATQETWREKWLARLGDLLDEARVGDIDARLLVAAKVAKTAPLLRLDNIADNQIRDAVNTLNAWSKSGELADQVREILNAATIAAENNQEETAP